MEKIADYTLLRWLWEGNYGDFYLATPPPRLQLDVEYVVVKVITGLASDDSFRRAARELRVFAAVSSPRLVALLDAGQDRGAFFYSMEYLPMGSLDAPAVPLDRSARLRVLADAARATHALHEAGVVHRDIKPANVMIDEDGSGKLADLGLAQLLTPGLTVTSMGLIRSVEYMDPGVIRGGRVSRASDVWSLGAVLHRVLTGSGIYGDLPAGDPLLALRRVLSSPPVLAPSLSPAEGALVRSCLSANPVARPLTALLVADGMESLAAEQQPVTR
jgi:serine/threonine protein kinase